VPVEGTVTLNGTPLPSATVMFIPTESGGGKNSPRQANGLTNEQGHFKLETVNQKGAITGTYKVTLTKKVLPPGVEPPKEGPNKMTEMMNISKKYVEVVPKIYTDQKSTPL